MKRATRYEVFGIRTLEAAKAAARSDMKAGLAPVKRYPGESQMAAVVRAARTMTYPADNLKEAKRLFASFVALSSGDVQEWRIIRRADGAIISSRKLA